MSELAGRRVNDVLALCCDGPKPAGRGKRPGKTSNPAFSPPIEFREIVYTTNTTKSWEARSGKPLSAGAISRPTRQPSRVHYLVSIERRENGSNPTGTINGWKRILNALSIHYQDPIEGATD